MSTKVASPPVSGSRPDEAPAPPGGGNGRPGGAGNGFTDVVVAELDAGHISLRVTDAQSSGSVSGPPLVAGAAPGHMDETLQARANKEALKISLDLIHQTGRTAQRVNRRLSTVFRYYTGMLALTFCIGIGGFAAALFSAFVVEPRNMTATITFAGLSAASFATMFVRAPTEAMERLGPNTAWLLTIVNTYWTKLAYFNDSSRAAEDLELADKEFAASMRRYMEGRLVAPRESDDSTERGASTKKEN